MLSLALPGRIFVYTRPTDMRKSFDGLAALVRDQLGADPLSGHLFVFRSRQGDRLKMLYWDEDGFVIVYKRLEAGTFRFPSADAAGVQIGATDLQMLELPSLAILAGALLAALPAVIRAVRIDPVTMLRAE